MFSPYCGACLYAALLFALPSLLIVFSSIIFSHLNPLLSKIASLAESTSSSIVFDEILATAGKDVVTKDISRLRGGWPMQDAFYVSI